MKGTILVCIQELLIDHHGGPETWNRVAQKAGLDPYKPVMAFADLPDEDIYKTITAVGETLALTPEQALDAFAMYFICEYAPRVYKPLYAGLRDARSFLQGLNALHDKVSKNTPNARPPRFDMEWRNEHTLVMNYKSQRALVDLAVSMVKATAKYFKEELRVIKTSPTTLEVVFPRHSNTKATVV